MNGFELDLESFIHEIFGSRCRPSQSNRVKGSVVSNLISTLILKRLKSDMWNRLNLELKDREPAWEADQSAVLMVYSLWQMCLVTLRRIVTQPGLCLFNNNHLSDVGRVWYQGLRSPFEEWCHTFCCFDWLLQLNNFTKLNSNSQTKQCWSNMTQFFNCNVYFQPPQTFYCSDWF